MTHSNDDMRIPPLTIIEIDCLKMYSDGKTKLQIAKALRCSEFSIEILLNQTQQRMSCATAAQMEALAVKQEII